MTPAYKCGNCGAILHPKSDEMEMTCEFCGALTPRALEPKAPPPEEKKPPTSEPAKKPPPDKRDWIGKFWTYFWYFPLSLTVIIPAGLAYDHYRAQLTWIGDPIIADVNGDGVEDVVGRWMKLAGGKRTTVVGWFDGKTRKLMWSTEFKADDVQMALASGTLVVCPKKPFVEMFALPSGASTGRADLFGEPEWTVGHGTEAFMYARRAQHAPRHQDCARDQGSNS